MSGVAKRMHDFDELVEGINPIKTSSYLADFNYSLFNETDTTIIASRVYDILRVSTNWDMAHHHTSYLDMVRLKYRTFQVEYPIYEDSCKLPSMFTEEFGIDLNKYSRLVDCYGNQFEVIVEKRDGHLYFTHGWSEIRNSYVDAECKGMWASLTYIRPTLFVLILKDRYYRDLIVKHIYPPLAFTLSRSLFGSDQNPAWAHNIPLPYYHASQNLRHTFVIILTSTDITSGFLTIKYGSVVSSILKKDAKYVRLIDDNGLEWNCSVEHNSNPYQFLRIGREWETMIRARNYRQGSHLMFGSPILGNATELFVKKIYD